MSMGQDRSEEDMGSPVRTCQDRGKTRFERQPPMPRWGEQQQARAPVEHKAHSRRRGAKEEAGNGRGLLR